MPSERDDQPVTSPSGRPLWAPWRIEYIRGIASGGCFLCDLLQGRGDAELVLHRGEGAFAMLNAFPYNSGHVLVAPYRHVPDISDLAEDEMAEVMRLVLRAKAALTKIMAPDAFNVGFNLGAAAGAGLRDHVHGHLVPRWVGDTNFMPVLGNTRVVPEALADTARVLREAWE